MSIEINYLKQGYKKFRQKYFEGENGLYKYLVENGQRPKYLIIACSDSRVDPSLILNCEPGDLFVIRNVANLVPPYEIDTHYHGTSAALEFGICQLGIKQVLVLGHSQCGGILSVLEPDPHNNRSDFISKWMELAKPSCERAAEEHAELSTVEQSNFCGRNSLLYSLENLRTFPWIKDKIEAGNLSLHAWYFELATGKMYVLNEETQVFETL